MEILLIGSGGREHALARKLAKNKMVKKVYCAPGNGGMELEDKCEIINLITRDELLEFAKKNQVDLTVVGPENLLIEGIVDLFNENDLKIFGPSQKGAMLEGSKSFSKDFMSKYNVKTAKYEVFYEAGMAIKYLKKQEYPIVIKADGLAAGKGVYISETFEDASNAIKEIMIDDKFKGAGRTVVIEEFLEGVEASILSITDGTVIKPFISAKDHKQIFDGDKGPNTGGMGVLAPNPYVTKEVMEQFEKEIMIPTLGGIKEENINFKGIIFFGIMITKKGIYLLEYNVRMGDPETQSVLELMESDFTDLIIATVDEKLENFNLCWSNNFSCNVVLASKGYPGTPLIGEKIMIPNDIKQDVYIAGAKLEKNILITTGGRVLSVVGKGVSKDEAIEDAYEKVKLVDFSGKYNRTDIGK
ncbi:MAG: phosphoribosylamine--glycine ligase [Sarcina sp.]